MTKTFVNYILILSVFLVACNNTHKPKIKGKTLGNLELSKAKPQPDDNLDIRYKAKDTNFIKDDFSAIYYVLVGDDIYAEDLTMEDKEEEMEANLHIPDSATAIAFTFKNDGNYDTNNNLGYVLELYDNDKSIPGALAAKSNFHLQMDDRMDIESSQTDSIVYWLKTDIEQHPGIEEDWQEIYAQTLLRNDRRKGEEYIKGRLAVIEEKNNLFKEDYNTLIFMYDQLQEEEIKDSIQKIAIDKYPRGKIAQSAFFSEFNKVESTEKKREVFKKYQDSIGKGGEFKDAMLSKLIQLALENGEQDQIQDYIDNYSDEQIRDHYARVLYNKGDLSKALDEQRIAIGDGGYPEVNEHYIQYLLENQDYKKAEEKASYFISKGKSTEKLLVYFKEAYKKNNGSVDGYDDKLFSLKEKKLKKRKEELETEIFDKELPDLFLSDSKGNKIELADMKGKTIILDFWATWCGPCIQSFPGMERAMELFGGNEDVKFYYVNTLERMDEEERQNKVENFMNKKDYAFDILYDQNENNGFKTVSNLNISSIPTKIIIGPDGKWNFTKVGYDGDNDKLIDEIKVMVELTQS